MRQCGSAVWRASSRGFCALDMFPRKRRPSLRRLSVDRRQRGSATVRLRLQSRGLGRQNLIFEVDILPKPEDDVGQSPPQACRVLGSGREWCEPDHGVPRSTSVNGDRDSGFRKAINFAKLTKDEVGDRHSGQSRSFPIGAVGGQGSDWLRRWRCRGHGLLLECLRRLRRRRRGGGRSKNAADQRRKA